jgi:hypothetical protein
MTSVTSALTLLWTLASLANMSQGFWIRLQYLEATNSVHKALGNMFVPRISPVIDTEEE